MLPQLCPGRDSAWTMPLSRPGWPAARSWCQGTSALGIPQRPAFPPVYALFAPSPCDTGWVGDGWTSLPPCPRAPGTGGLLQPLLSPLAEPFQDSQMAIIIAVVSVLLFLFVASVLLCFVLGEHWRQRRTGSYMVQAVQRRLRCCYQAQLA